MSREALQNVVEGVAVDDAGGVDEVGIGGQNKAIHLYDGSLSCCNLSAPINSARINPAFMTRIKWL